MAARVKTPLWSRGLDTLYFVYIFAALFFPFLIDFAAYYPVERPHWSTNFYEWMLREFNDPLFVRHPAFLGFYTLVEAVYLVPHGLWCLRGLIKDDDLAPFHNLIWASYMVQSCAVCSIEIWYAQDWPAEDINKTVSSYLVFTVIAAVMMLDNAFRVKADLMKKQKLA